MNKSVSNWYHRRPKEYYDDCVRMFGKPTALSNKKHGFAFWKTKGLFDEHLLRDEDVKHCVPRPHHDYFYSSIQFYIPKNRVMDVLKISGSINYDGLKKLLTARCGGIGANYATLYLGMKVGSGEMSIEQVKKDDLYPRMIRGEVLPRDEIIKEMTALKRSNKKKNQKKIKDEFADYAYERCYVKTRKNRKSSKKSKTLKNHKNELCLSRKHTACCPHNKPKNGKYIATNEKSILHFKGKKYELHTCCTMCADAMNAMASKDPSLFKKKYVSKYDRKGNIIAKNAHTGEEVQTLRLV